jgi:hypothetical protein
MVVISVLVQHLDRRRNAVSGAGGVGDYLLLPGVVSTLVDAEDDGGVLVAGGGGDDDFFGAAIGMRPGFIGIGEFAGGLDNDIDAVIFPGNGGGVAFREHLDFPAVNDNRFIFSGHLAGIRAVNAVPLEQVGVGPGVGQVVDRHNFYVILMALEDCP